MRGSLFLVFALLAAFCAAQDRAHVVVHKTIVEIPVVEGREFVVEYNLFNLGSTTARDILVTDDWPADSFTHVEGETTVSLDVLAAGENHTQTVTLIPKKAFDFDSQPAQVEYVYGEDSEETHQAGVSSNFGILPVITEAQFEKLTSTFIKEWGTFVLLNSLAIVLPWVQYTQRAGKGKKHN
eukprot:PLAT14440.1.p2 GENE.PLAT14440.1~~PLAT14440.1.p2  ORF type:complete len:182 (-),score=74.03 PLAT14440.1:232-777(-)